MIEINPVQDNPETIHVSFLGGFRHHKIFWRIVLAVVVLFLLLVNGYLYFMRTTIYKGAGEIAEQSNQNADILRQTRQEKSRTTIEGRFCGGIAGIPCPEEYTCKYDGNYPDAGGTCVKN